MDIHNAVVLVTGSNRGLGRALVHALKQAGAAKVYAYCTHPVLSGRAIENIEKSVLDELVVTNTIPLSAAAQACDRIRQLDIAPVVAEAVRRISNEESISAMFR